MTEGSAVRVSVPTTGPGSEGRSTRWNATTVWARPSSSRAKSACVRLAEARVAQRQVVGADTAGLSDGAGGLFNHLEQHRRVGGPVVLVAHRETQHKLTGTQRRGVDSEGAGLLGSHTIRQF